MFTRRQEFTCTQAEFMSAAYNDRLLLNNEALYVLQPDGTRDVYFGDGVKTISQLRATTPSISYSAIKSLSDAAAGSATDAANSATTASQQAAIATTKAEEAMQSAQEAESIAIQTVEQNMIKIAQIDKELNDFQKTLSQVNINQEAKQSVTGYGVISLPKNAANGQVSAVVKGNTITNKAGIGDTSPQTITLDSTKTYLLIKTDGGTVNIDVVDTAVPTKITSKASTTLTWTTGKIGLYELLPTETGLATDLAKKYTYVSSAKSTVSASRLKSVNENLVKGDFKASFTTTWQSVWDTKVHKVDQNKPIYINFNVEGDHRPIIKLFDSNMNIINDTASNIFKSITGVYNGANIVFVNNQYSININVANVNNTIIEVFPYKGVHYIQLGLYSGSNATARTVYQTNRMISQTSSLYAPYKESTQYLPNVGELRSLPNGTKDEINVTSGLKTQRIGVKTNVASGTVINYADMATGGQFEAWGASGEHVVGVKGDTLAFTATSLNYQLAQEIVTPIEVSGNLISYPSGTIYVENAVADAGIYTDKFSILQQDLPIKEIEKISKVDFTTGIETELDVSQAVIATDKLSFTHPSLTANDIVFTTYFYDLESTLGETTVTYYDSRHTVKDKTLENKFYQWTIEVDNGTPSIKLVEV